MNALDQNVARLLLSGPDRCMAPPAAVLFRRGLGAMAERWRADEPQLRAEAARLGIAPMWTGRFFGELLASAPTSQPFRYPRERRR